MHKQRLPFNGGPGGFGGSAFNFNAPQFGDGAGLAEGLNGMAFLGNSSTKPLMRSISRQRSLVDGAGLDSLPPPLPTMGQHILSGAGVGRGQRFPVPPISSYYGHYEGDRSMSSMSLRKDTSSPENLNQTQWQEKNTPRPVTLSDTDSESDLRSQQKSAEFPESRWRRAFGCIMDTLPEQRRQRVEVMIKRCGQSAIAKHLLVLLQLLALVVGVGFRQITRFGWLCGGVRYRMRGAKFQLRSSMRQLLWRLANAKGNDTLLFLIVVLMTPWLFLLSLVGFAVSFVFSMRTGVAEGVRQLRRRVF
ncbi:uncharacterized protein LOC6545850 [Drosophila erecta]|uniref:Transmembrane protein n=1 Tax=Drosophila erecta TaxID=7220 RepID=B3NEU2_DROER|nr:uncharacterized protein LOC6545850 [Drosophila erecta]EDV50215.1 uncharacterized protein Dere_GG14818 [Drosophila erecta]